MCSISIRTLGFSFVAALTILSVAVASTRAGTIPVYASGHCDLCADYEDSALSLHYHFHSESPGKDEDGNSLVGEIEPSSLYTRVSDATKTIVPSGSTYSFLGAPAGSNVWVLSQNPTSGQPFLGFGTEELDDEVWTTGVTYKLMSVSGPGQFSMWMSPPFGDPIVYWATSNGINSSDVYTQAALGHSHANWGFTSEGVYDVQMQLSGTPAGGSMTYSEVETFTFLVGSSTVPEPGPIAMLSSGAVGLALSFWKRRRNKAMRA